MMRIAGNRRSGHGFLEAWNIKVEEAPVRLTISNFGPIRHTNIKFGDLSIFVGPQAFGNNFGRPVGADPRQIEGLPPQVSTTMLDIIKRRLPHATQQAIMAEIEAEQALVAANRELIARFGQKIQAILARIWGEPEETAKPVLSQ
jgi:hypothetical protein